MQTHVRDDKKGNLLEMSIIAMKDNSINKTMEILDELYSNKDRDDLAEKEEEEETVD